jgi:3-methyladenine DNA glycosylase AlkD
MTDDARHMCEQLLHEIRAMGSEKNRRGMGRYGINVENAAGVSVYDLRDMAKPHTLDHDLAAELWASGLHEARLLAAFVDDPAQVTPEQMEAWAAEFDSWDVTDQVTTDLFHRTPYAWDKAVEWAGRDDEWVKRGGFALMAGLAWHHKKADDDDFAPFFTLIEREATDPRNFVKKAVNWALRNIGKRNAALNAEAVACAQRILDAHGGADARGGDKGDQAARWVAKDALKELTSDKMRKRLGIG